MKKLQGFFLAAVVGLFSACGGDSTDTEIKSTSTGTTTVLSGEQIFQAKCAACHLTGAGGAPRVVDQSDWATRLKKGRQALLDSAVDGFKGMPPKGGCNSCSDEDIHKAVDWILSKQ